MRSGRLVVWAVVLGCGGAPGPEVPPAAPEVAAEAEVSPVQTTLHLDGSTDAMPAIAAVVDAWRGPDDEATITVGAMPGGLAVRAVVDGDRPAAFLSRSLRSGDQMYASKAGVGLVSTLLGYDALVFVSSDDVGVRSLTRAQLVKVWQGDIASWTDVGGRGEVALHLLPPGNALHDEVRDSLARGKLAGDIGLHPDEAAIVAAVAEGTGAMGVVSRRAALDLPDGVVVVPLGAGDDAVSPLALGRIAPDAYPFVRPVIVVTPGVPQGPWLDLLRFAVSQPGQTALADAGVLPLPEAWKGNNPHLVP